MTESAADATNTFRVFDWLWTSGQLSERGVAGLATASMPSAGNLARLRAGGRP